jgi:carbon storage regulator
MLVLTRKKGESIMIDNHISVVVLNVEGDTVKLGIVAPKEVGVFRSEIYEAIQQANKQAMAASVNLEDIQKLFEATKKGD